MQNIAIAPNSEDEGILYVQRGKIQSDPVTKRSSTPSAQAEEKINGRV